MSSTYLVSDADYAASQYETLETGGVYHETREVASSAGSQMFRTYNAQFNVEGDPPLWTLNNSSSPAYATVQNPDGSIHYFSMPKSSPPWATWNGSGNNAVYNAVDYGLVEGAGQSPTTRAANVAAIQAAVNAAIAKVVPGKSDGGGTVVIPAGLYELGGTISPVAAATITIANITGGLAIRGESAGTTLIQYGTPPTSGTAPSIAADIFDVSSSGNPSQFGIRFRDLTLQYANGLTVPTSGAVAINLFDGVADTSAENCGFVNCPQAFAAGSSGSALHSGLVGCTVYQNEYSSATQVLLSGPECFVLYSELYQTPGGPTGNTGITVQSGAEGCRIYGCHVSDFNTGISVAQGSKFTYITDCEVDAFQGLTVLPNDGGQIYGVFVTACKFAMIENTATSSLTWGIYIDTAGGLNTNVEGISIADCLVFGYQDAGLQINKGQSISVIGGKYSSNGQSPGSTELGAGIAIAGTCADVRIVGADCSGVFNFWPTVQNPSPGSPPVTQPYGISVVSGVTAVCVADCNLMNNETAALYVPDRPVAGTRPR
jgi:hypothetical protein